MMRRWPFGGTCDVRIPIAGLTNANVANPKTYHFADSSKRLTGMPQTKAARNNAADSEVSSVDYDRSHHKERKIVGRPSYFSKY